MFDNIGGGEILIILLVFLVFFGAKKIPDLQDDISVSDKDEKQIKK